MEKCYNNISSLYGDTFSNLAIIKSFTLTFMKQKELKNLTDIKSEKQLPILTYWWLMVSFSKILNIIVTIGIISFWSYLFFNGEVTIWEIVMFISFSSIFLAIVEDLTWILEWLFRKMSGIKDYFEILDTKLQVVDIENAKILNNVIWNIKFENITFSYDKKREIIKNVNFNINSWEKIAFVWHTGSWKTTIINLLLRFFELGKWKILIDNNDISEVTQDSLRENIWVVFQENSLFNATIFENIILNNKTATKEDVIEVCRKSHSLDFINSLSDKFDTLVWERWIKLSWWEKQRIAIARAFLKNAPILILDEATSALDANTEKFLQKSLEQLMKNRTTFIIAHRLSTIRKADKIFLFENWEIKESWTYKELLEKWGYFTKLVEAQIWGFIN